jgi:hypothetical protein
VPDSQELWLDEASDVSLIVEFVRGTMPHLAARALSACSAARVVQARKFTRCACATQDEGSAQFFWSDVASLNSCAGGGAAQPRAHAPRGDRGLRF